MTRALQTSSSVRRSKIREHYRSAPVDRDAAAKQAMTIRLAIEVARNEAAIAALPAALGEASLLMLETDPDYMAVL